MHNFKVGDKVVRKAHHNNDIFLHYVGPAPYVVTAVSTDGYFLCINNWEDSGGDRYPWSRSNFTLVAEQDDPLPPAPESGLYFNHNGTLSASLKLAEGSIALGTNTSLLKVRLTPETALDLAYDLRRMAMKIKRKEKQV